MSFLISNAFADTGITSPQNSNLSFIVLSVFCVLFIYFFMWRPQSKRLKAQQSMMNSLKVDDEVTTSGGLLGKIINIDNSIVSISISENTTVKLQKTAISNILPKGTIK